MPYSLAYRLKKLPPGGKLELTSIQKEIFDFIWDKSQWRPPRPPAFRIIAAHLGYKDLAGASGAILAQLRLIRAKGWELPEWEKKKRVKKNIVP